MNDKKSFPDKSENTSDPSLSISELDSILNKKKKKSKERKPKAEKTSEGAFKKSGSFLKNKIFKKKKKKNENIAIYDPELQSGFVLSIALGYFLRFFAIALSLFGVVWLFADAVGLASEYGYVGNITTGIKWFPVFFCCLYTVCAFSLIFLRKKTAIFGGIMLVIPVIVGTAIYKNIIAYIISGLSRVQDCIYTRLTRASFAATKIIPFPTSGFFCVPEPEYVGDEISEAVKEWSTTLCYFGIFTIITLLALVFSLLSAKRMRLLPMVLLGGSVCVFCFTYNLCQTNSGIACILAGLCSAIVLSCYDKIYKDVGNSIKGRAYSGYASSLAGIIAVLILLTFTSKLNKPFTKIEFIAEPIEYARNYVTTILTGGDPANNRMNTLSKTVSDELKDISFTEDLLFEIESYSKSNVYLRSWIGDDFSYSKDTWSLEDNKEYKKFTDSLSSYLQSNRYTRYYSPKDSYNGDDITYNFRKLFNNAVSSLKEIPKSFADSVKYGYITSFVDIEYVENTGNLMVAPQTFVKDSDTKNLGFFEYLSRSSAYSGSYSMYSDGIYKSSWHNVYKEYSGIAMIPKYTASNYGDLSEKEKNYYILLSEFLKNEYSNNTSLLVRYHRTLEDYEKDEYKEKFRKFISDNQPSGMNLEKFRTEIFEDFLNLSYNDRYEFFVKIVEIPSLYYDFVKETYLDYPEESVGIEEVWKEIGNDIENAKSDHEKMLIIVNYLSKEYTYSVTPNETFKNECKKRGKDYSDIDFYSSDLDNFLSVTKTGYCVQFASAAALLARKAGIPARYVQGYIASDFGTIYDENNEKTGKYKSEIYGDDAHAWVEIYINGLGWCTYEPTIVYYENIYYVSSSGESKHFPTPAEIREWYIKNKQTSAPVTTSVPTEETDNSENEKSFVKEYTKRILLIIVGLIAITVITIIVIKRLLYVKRITEGRRALISDAIYGNCKTEEEFERCAKFIIDSIFYILSITGYKPLPGETPADFAKRVESPAPPSTKAELKERKIRDSKPYKLTDVIGHIEAEEFGKSMTKEGLYECGEYLTSLSETEYSIMSPLKKFWYRFVLLRI